MVEMEKFFKIIIGISSIIIILTQFAFADLTKKDIEDIRAIVREEVSREVESLKNETNAKIEGLRNEMNARFDGIDNRFEQINRQFNWLYILLSGIIALIGVMVSSILWLAKQDRPVTTKHYNEILKRESYLEKELVKLKEDMAKYLAVAQSS